MPGSTSRSTDDGSNGDSIQVKPQFAPWVSSPRPCCVRGDTPSPSYIRTTYVLRCVIGACVPQARHLVARVRSRPRHLQAASGKGRSGQVQTHWPVLVSHSQIVTDDYDNPAAVKSPWRADAVTLPGVSYRISPQVVRAVAFGLGALLAVVGILLAVLAIPSRPPPEPEPEPEPQEPEEWLAPLEHALVLLEADVRSNGGADQRRALELVAEELEARDFDPLLARRARDLAWSEDVPPVSKTRVLATQVRAAIVVHGPRPTGTNRRRAMRLWPRRRRAVESGDAVTMTFARRRTFALRIVLAGAALALLAAAAASARRPRRSRARLSPARLDGRRRSRPLALDRGEELPGRAARDPTAAEGRRAGRARRLLGCAVRAAAPGDPGLRAQAASARARADGHGHPTEPVVAVVPRRHTHLVGSRPRPRHADQGQGQGRLHRPRLGPRDGARGRRGRLAIAQASPAGARRRAPDPLAASSDGIELFQGILGKHAFVGLPEVQSQVEQALSAKATSPVPTALLVLGGLLFLVLALHEGLAGRLALPASRPEKVAA